MYRLRRGQSLTNLACVPSLVSLSSKSVITLSSSKPLFPHFIDLSTYITHHFNIAMCEVVWPVHHNYFIVHSPRTRDAPMHTKNLNGLSIIFYHSQSAHRQRSDVYKTLMDCQLYFIVYNPLTRNATTCTQLPPSVGLAQALGKK